MALLDLETLEPDWGDLGDRVADMLPFVDELATAQDPKSERWGLVDRRGQWIVAPTFADAWAFHDGHFAVQRPGRKKWGYANAKGEVVIAEDFDDASVFSDGLVAVSKKGYFAYLDAKGALAFSGDFTDALPFSEGLAPVRLGEVWGYVDRKGEHAIAPKFSRAFCFAGGRAQVVVGEDDVRSKHVARAKKTRSSERKGRFGIVDRGGSLLAPARWDFQESELDIGTTPALRFHRDIGAGAPCFVQGAAFFSEGLAAVRENWLWGYCDERGAAVVEPRFARAKPFRDGRAEVTAHVAGSSATRPETLSNPLRGARR